MARGKGAGKVCCLFALLITFFKNSFNKFKTNWPMSDSDLSVGIGCMMFYRAHGPRTTVSHCLYMNLFWAEQLTLSKRIDSYNYFQIVMVIIHPVVN